MKTERLFNRIETIVMQNLTKRFGSVTAVDDVSLTVHGG